MADKVQTGECQVLKRLFVLLLTLALLLLYFFNHLGKVEHRLFFFLVQALVLFGIGLVVFFQFLDFVIQDLDAFLRAGPGFLTCSSTLSTSSLSSFLLLFSTSPKYWAPCSETVIFMTSSVSAMCAYLRKGFVDAAARSGHYESARSFKELLRSCCGAACG